MKENYVFNECEDWLKKYKETYNIFEQIRLSSQNKDLKIESNITKTSTEENGVRYIFSLNLKDTSNSLLLEGPNISISTKNRKTIDYIVITIIEMYLSKNKSTYNEITEDMKLRIVGQADADILEVSGIEEGSYGWDLFMNSFKNYKQNTSVSNGITSYYNQAKAEKIEQDKEFRIAIDYSDGCFQSVLQYTKRKKK